MFSEAFSCDAVETYVHEYFEHFGERLKEWVLDTFQDNFRVWREKQDYIKFDVIISKLIAE